MGRENRPVRVRGSRNALREAANAVAEQLVRAIERINSERRADGRAPLTQDWLRERAGLSSPAPISSLLNRTVDGRPGVAALKKIADALELNWSDLSVRAESAAAIARAHPLPYPDGELPAICGYIDPQSFLLQQRFEAMNSGVVPPVLRRDLMTAEFIADFPHPITALGDELHAPFMMYERSMSESLLENIDKATSVRPRPDFFYISRWRATQIQAAMTLRGIDAQILELSDWTFRMSPNFCLIGPPRGSTQPHSLNAHCSSLVFRLAQDTNVDLATTLRDTLKVSKCILVPSCSPARSNLESLLRTLKLSDVQIKDVPNIRTCIELLTAGVLRDVLVVGHAPQYWSVMSQRMKNSDNHGMAPEILITDEDLHGRPREFRADAVLKTKQPAIPLQVRNWIFDEFIVVCRSDNKMLTQMRRDFMGRFIRVVSGRLRHSWNDDLRDQKLRWANAMSEEYQIRGGARIDAQTLVDFIDYGMSVHPGPQNFSGLENLPEFVALRAPRT